MKNLSAVFTIIKEKNCPLYKVDECLHLSEKTLACPKGKEMCLILVRDLTELLFRFLREQPDDLSRYADTVFNCSGCNGLIKFSLRQPADLSPPMLSAEEGGALARIDAAELTISGKIVNCSLFKDLPSEQVKAVLGHFREIALDQGAVLIREGEKNCNLYLVLDGELTVENGGIQLATLAEGEICGEMSYLGADLAISSVIAARKSVVLAIAGEVFGQLLGNNHSIQRYMAQLLASRLQKTNAERARELESCMTGRLDSIVPAELFQVFHMHQKTGVLAMELAEGSAKVSFREGCIINARYGQRANEEAIFKILAEKKGVYRFTTGLSPKEMRAAEIGDFMMLLMEGVKRVDEEQDRQP